VYIVTTSKRIHQITASVFVGLALISGVAMVRYYQNYHAQPSMLQEQVLSVINQTGSLSKTWYDLDRLKAEAKLMTLNQLKHDLTQAGLPFVEEGAALLLPQATEFLDDDASFHQWLELTLNDMSVPATQVAVEDLANHQQRVSSNEACFTIEKYAHGWKLVSILGCTESP
jgi:hypothetical protein